MRVFISSDMEGTAGIVDWSQCRPGGHDYELGRRLLLDEVNAAADGARDAGATDVLVNDAHGAMANLAPASLRARYCSGRHKPRYMMEGLTAEFDAVLFVSYHGSMGTHGVLSHTYNPRAIHEVRLNGNVVGESGVNLLVAIALRVPVVLVTGDQVAVDEATSLVPGITGVVVKEAVTRTAAVSLAPAEACARIREGAREALAARSPTAAVTVTAPYSLEVEWRTADMAQLASLVGGVERTGARTVAIADDEPARIYERFVGTVTITRAIVED